MEVKNDPFHPTGELKIREGGEGECAPLPLRPLEAQLRLVWFLERERPLSFASRIVLSLYSLLPRVWG